VQNQINDGKTLDQIKKEGLPSKYETWGTAYTNAEEWITNLYIGLKNENTVHELKIP
jgi:hypothetical protein